MNSKVLTGRRVLVVEDEMLILMMIEDMLADLGCTEVVTAATVQKALVLVADQEFDAAMLDMNLNGNDTYEVADALAARRVPYFFSTGNNLSSIREEYRTASFLRKPYTLDDLAHTFIQILSQ